MHKIFLILTGLVIFSYCGVGHTGITTKANPVYNNERIHSAVIICSIQRGILNTNFYNDFENALQDEFIKINIFNKCIVTNKYIFEKLDFDKIISDLNPKAIIIIDEGDRIMKGDLVVESFYDIAIINSNSKEKMWQAQFDVYGTELIFYNELNNGKTLALVLFENITNSTRKDRMMLFK